MFWWKENSQRSSIRKDKENCQPRDRKYSLSIREHCRTEHSSIPTKIEKTHSLLYSDKAESSKAGTKASPACAKEKRQPSFAHQNMPTVREVLLLKFPPIPLSIFRSSFLILRTRRKRNGSTATNRRWLRLQG